MVGSGEEIYAVNSPLMRFAVAWAFAAPSGVHRTLHASSLLSSAGKDVKPTQRAMSPAMRCDAMRSKQFPQHAVVVVLVVVVALTRTWKSNLVSCRKRKITTVCVPA